MTLWQENKRQGLLKNSARVTLLTAQEMEEELLEMANTTASRDSSERTKRVVKVLGVQMNSAYFIYEVDFRNLENLHEADTKDQVVASVNVLLCDSPYDMRGHSELET